MEATATWLLTALSVTGVILNIKRNRACFVVWLFANAGWIAVNLLHGIYAQAVLFVIYSGLSVWGYVAWGRQDKDKSGSAGIC